MAIVPPCEFVLKKHNELGKAFAHVYLLSVHNNNQQIVIPGAPIKFSNYSKLASIAWLTKDELTFLKAGTFKIEFSMNYANNASNAQVALFLNGVPMIGTFGTSSPLISGVSRLSGTYVLKLNVNDKIKLVGVSNAFTIKSAGPNDEIIATWIVTEE